jgi:hypothetical protein
MNKDNFEKNMQDWAEQEIKAAPDLRPTEEMYRLVESKKRKRWIGFPLSRWSTIGIALASVILFLIGYLALVKPDFIFTPLSPQVADAPQREVTISKSPLSTLASRPPDQGKGKGKGPASFQQLDFQVHRGEVNLIEFLDIRQIPSQLLILTASDSYRLLLFPKEARFAYVFQQDPIGQFQALHLQAAGLPLAAGDQVYLPQPPNWFYPSGKPGNYQLLIIASPIRIDDLENLYEQYTQAAGDEAITAAQTALQDYLETIGVTTNMEAELWWLTFTFGAVLDE